MSAPATVVIVDGLATSRMIYGQVAKSLGEAVQVHSFSAAYEALRWLRAQPADLVITDARMRNLDGPEFVAVFRKHSLNRNVPVVVVTADRDAALRARLLRAGATAVMHKPISPFQLRMRLHNLLRSR